MAWDDRIDPITGLPSKHAGVDLQAGMNQSLGAMRGGVVTNIANEPNGYGWYADIKHDDGTTGRYAHANVINKGVGQRIENGEELGLVGSTGRSTGPHVHFEHRDQSGRAVDPRNFLASAGVNAGPAMGGSNTNGVNPMSTFEQYAKSIEAQAPNPQPSADLIAAMTRNNQQRGQNLPLALGAMLSGDKQISAMGNMMYKDANDARGLIPLGDDGFIDPSTGQYHQSPIGKERRQQRLLERAITGWSGLESSRARIEQQAGQNSILNQLSMMRLNEAQQNQDRLGLNRTTQNGPVPGQPYGGAPVVQPPLQLPLAAGRVPQTASPVLPPSTTYGATQGAPVVPASAMPNAQQGAPVVPQSAPAAQPVPAQISTPAAVAGTPAAPPVVAAQPESQTPAEQYLSNIGTTATALGHSNDGRGEVFRTPYGETYIKTPQGFLKADNAQYTDYDTFNKTVPLVQKSLDTLKRGGDFLKTLEVEEKAFGAPTAAMSKLPNAVQTWVGPAILTKEQQIIRTRVLSQASQYIKELSGAAVSDKEATRLMAFLPSADDDIKTIRVKIEGANREAAANAKTWGPMMESSARNRTNGGAAPAAPVAAPVAAGRPPAGASIEELAKFYSKGAK